MKPRTIADVLARFFLENGNFVDSSGPMSLQASPAGAKAKAAFEQEAPGFAGLAVQGVGFAEAAEFDAVHVYVSRGSKRELSRLPDVVENVPVHVHNIGKLYVKDRAKN
jgi:hypothetical protein